MDLRILVAVMLGISQSHACVPGGKDSLGLLKQYVGIDWIEHGVEKGKTGHNPTEYVKKSTDLDCDLSVVSKCKWGNYPNGTDKLDQIDFQLFNKTTNVAWNSGLLAPGPNPPIGTKVILAGSKKPTPQEAEAAIWYSNPVKCQKKPGTLKFDFWLYSHQSAIEVLMLRVGKTPLEAIHTIRSNCVFWSPPAAPCSVPIPAVNEPFYIGIRVHNLHGAGGAMAAITNIKYEASDICTTADSPTSTVPTTTTTATTATTTTATTTPRATTSKPTFDLGSGFYTDEMDTPVIDYPVEDPLDLTCMEFDRLCEWGTPEEGQRFKIGMGTVDPVLWEKATGKKILPDAPFAIMRPTPNSGPSATGFLTSSTIPCQNDDAVVQFTYYSSPGVDVELCVLSHPFMKVENCVPVEGKEDTHYVALPYMKGTMDGPFHIAVKATKFTNPDTDFIIVDNLEYLGEFCEADAISDENMPFYLGKDFQVGSLGSGNKFEPVEVPADLECSAFDASCRWGKGPYPVEQWMKGSGDIDLDEWDKVVGTQSPIAGPELPVAVIRGKDADKNGEGNLYSDPLPCQRGDGSVKLRYWKSEDVTLALCIVSLPKFTEETCVDIEGQMGELVTVPVKGRIDHEFVLSIKAGNLVNEESDFAIVDDISYEGQFCQKKQKEDSDVVACQALKCDFESGNPCGYKRPRINNKAGRFNIIKKQLGYRGTHTAVGTDKEWYAGAQLRRRAPTAALVSPDFHLSADRKLSFVYDRSIMNSEFWVCTNTFDDNKQLRQQSNCRMAIGGRFTLAELRTPNRTTTIDLHQSTKKVYIMAHHHYFKAGRAPMAVDNIKLLSKDGQPLC